MIIALVSSTVATAPVDILKAAVPIGIGLASAAYLTIKAAHQKEGTQPIPTVPIRKGDTTHDAEYFSDPDMFLKKCVEEHGPVFNLYIMNQHLTAVSGSMVREVFMTEDFSFTDAIDDMTGIRAFSMSMVKSNRHPDTRVPHDIIRDNISPNLPLFTPRIVKQLQATVDEKLGFCEGKLFEKPLEIFQQMIAGAMANVFMGPEIAKSDKVIESFIYCTYDFGKVLGTNPNNKSFWRAFNNRTKYNYLNPLQKHITVLVEAATPVILERRQQEKEATERGEEWDRPLDIMQRLLDNFEKYNLVDIEDLCGHLLLLVLASVHTTTDTSANLCYYLAAFPEHVEPLYQEQMEVLDQITQERQAARQKMLNDGDVASEQDFEGTDMDPKQDRDLTAAAIKRMVKMDSYVREVFRYRGERLGLPHQARQNMELSNGMMIRKGGKVIVNMHSVHQDSALQGEDPYEFRPWRFVGKSKSATKAATDFLAFGIGRHACPGRFLAIQELKTVGVLMVANYSKIEIQDPSRTKEVLLSRIGNPVDTGLIFTSRVK